MTSTVSASRGRRLRRACVVAFLVALAVLVPVGPASAHATLLKSDPPDGAVLQKSPDIITFTFDETVHLTPTSIQVFDAEGNPVDAEVKGQDAEVSAAVPDDLGDGTYVVAWRVISADSHPVAGSITFSVGAPSATVAPPKIATGPDRGLQVALGVTAGVVYLGLFLAGGLAVFAVWALRDVRLRPEVAERLAQVRWVAAGVVVVGSSIAIPLNGANDLGLRLSGAADGDALDLSLVGGDVVVLVLQTVGLVTALVALRRGWSRWLTTVAAAVAVAAPALVGHSRATSPVPVVLASDVLHLLAGATWLGGLVGLALTLGALRGRSHDAAAVVARFSAIAAAVLGVLTVTGTIAAWRIVDSWSALVQTGYGRVLLVKIGVAATAAAVAGWNRYRLVPGVRAGVGHEAQRSAALRVRTAVRGEAALLVVVLGLTGFLVDLSPNEQASVAPVVASRVDAVVVGTTKVLATVAPGTIGPNTLTVQVQDESGEPLEGFAPPTVRVSSDKVDLGEVPARPIANGTYAASVVFPQAGTWHVQVSLRATQFDNPVTEVDVQVR